MMAITCFLAIIINFYSSYWSPPSSALFPYTTLFRSRLCRVSPRKSLRLLTRRTKTTVATGTPSHRRTRATTRSGSTLLTRSEEHTSERQSRGHLVCRLLLEKQQNDRHDVMT